MMSKSNNKPITTHRRTVEDTVLAILQSYLPEHSQRTTLNRHSKLDDVALDSLDLIESVFELEQAFDVILDSATLEALQTVADLIDAVNRQCAAAGVSKEPVAHV